MTSYQEFLASKAIVVPNAGVDVAAEALHPALFSFQRDIVRWALRKGRSAILADTGLGKSIMQLTWAQHAAARTLILAPLAVAQQTVREGERWGIPVTYARSQDDAAPVGITITNYEMVDRFDAGSFEAVVLDESSVLKSHDGKTRGKLIAQFQQTPMRLCCTATPAPNDIAELANHAEFLGILTRAEMLARFFVHDDKGWRLKGHAREPFYRWLASWGMSLKRPSDIGYSDDGYVLPPLSIEPVILPVDYRPEGQLFFIALKGITDRSHVRKSTLAARVAAAATLIRDQPGEPWIAWVGLNAEQDALADALGDQCISVYGSLSPEEKTSRIHAWLAGDRPVLLSKVSIAGFGLNLQRCSKMVFVGLSDSYESYYQAIRRCWRYGQERPVTAYVVLTEPEEAIYQNVLRKEREAEAMGRELVRHVAAFAQAEIGHGRQHDAYEPATPMRLPAWLGAA